MSNQPKGADTLKPCPFCGGPVELEQTESYYDDIHGRRKWWGVVCRNMENLGGTCAVSIRPSASEAAAVGRWNKRAAPESTGTSEPDRNMDGAREFINAILMGQPIWPNPWGQDVAAAAYFIHRQRTDAAPEGTSGAVVKEPSEEKK